MEEAKSEDIYNLRIPFLNNDINVEQQEVTEEAAVKSFHNPTGTTFFKTTFNALNALSGIGILSIPYALASGGWLSLILLFIIATVTFYTSLLIQRCMVADSTIRSYPDIGERAFGKNGRLLCSTFMNLELYLAATAILILEGDHLSNLLPHMEFEFNGFTIRGNQIFIMLVALVILPTTLLNNMSILSYISATGVLASFVILGSIFWAGAFDGIRFREKGQLLNVRGIPAAVSLYTICYCAHPIFTTIYSSMENKKNFSRVMFLTFLVSTITYALVAVFGYLMFGSNLESQITLNLPISKVSSKVAFYTALVNPIAKYALVLTPVMHNIENKFQSYCNRRSFSFLFRTTLTISTVCVALAIPFFGLLMSLVGAFLTVTVSILLPCLCYLKISGAYRRTGFEVGIIGCILVIGAAILVIGTYTSVIEIIGQF